ncbi:MAG: AbrB/MazE/SpoVT family DNA-binding domain-containing protein [Candidatus Woesearchaeota archaeon]|nr:AbrB/MazE/SpoVT family DNA-binding domain-containing protein [Candidatus Woesearchaeota archaeon]
MRRKIVQHGPNTLTISIPADWVREHGMQKGDEVNVERVNQGLLLTTDKGVHLQKKTINIKGIKHVTAEAFAALYKRGYDEIVIQYSTPEERDEIHAILSRGYMGFEIIQESPNEMYIRNVTEPSKKEFKTLFRRIFYFLLAISEDSVVAIKEHDGYQRLIQMNDNIKRLTEFCRRMIAKHGQKSYSSDTAIYYILEHLEKIAMTYTEINEHLSRRKKKTSEKYHELYMDVDKLLRVYQELFFQFTLDKSDAFVKMHNEAQKGLQKHMENAEKDDLELLHLFEKTSRQICSLNNPTLVLHL